MRGNFLFKLLDRYIGVPLCFLLSFFRGNPPANKSFKKILVTKLSAMGDTILMIPMLRALKEEFPGAHITMTVTSINKSIASNCSYIDDLIIFEPQKIIFNPFVLIRFLKNLFSGKYDVAIDADQWLRTSALITFFSGAPVRVGFKTDSQHKHFLFTHVVFHEKKRHEMECFFDLLRAIGLKPQNKSLEYEISEKDAELACNELRKLDICENDRFVILHVEVPEHAKQRSWPDENFSILAAEIIKKFKMKVILTGTSRISGLLSIIKDNCLKILTGHQKNSVCTLSGLSLEVMAGVIKSSSLVICGNTGLMHLACAVGANIIGLHGPTDPDKWGPVGKKSKIIKSGLKCSPCLYLGFEYKCNTNNCMKTITPNDVIKKIDF